MIKTITFYGALSFFAITHNASIHAEKIKDDISSGTKILFCTKEISILSVSQVSDSASGKGPDPAGHIVEDQGVQGAVHDSLSYRPTSRLFDTRHCFLAKAFVIKNKNNTFSLSGLLTYGYAGAPAERGLSEKGRQAGQSYSEQFLGNDTVACVPIFSEPAIGSKENRGVLIEKWSRATYLMQEYEMTEGYHPVDHNCCTAAYNAAKGAGCDLSKIDPSSFNFLGAGLMWNTTHNPFSSSKGSLSSGAASILANPLNFSVGLREAKADLLSRYLSDCQSAAPEKKEQGDDADL